MEKVTRGVPARRRRQHIGSLTLVIVLLGLVVVGMQPGCTVTPGNQAPIADAGPDQEVGGGFVVFLDGSNSRDPDGSTIGFVWSQTAGPTVELRDVNTPMPSFRAPNVTTTIRIGLTVTDGGGLTATDSVSIDVTALDNVPPIADAGSALVVRGTEMATLSAAGSSDPDGDALTFTWTQVSGAAVTLTGADTATPSFVAPNVNGDLVFEVTVDDGNGHTDSDRVTVTVSREASILFVANLGGNNIGRFVDLGDKNGNVAPDTLLVGSLTMLAEVSDIVVHRENYLIAVNRSTNSMNLYLASAVSGGNVPPAFIVRGPATLLDRPTRIDMPPGEDLVFVSNTGTSSNILVFPGPSDVIFNGDLAPVRVISSVALDLPGDIHIDAQDRLYVANTGARNVLVFHDASAIDGDTVPNRTLTSALFTDPVALDVDDADRLYVVNSGGTILVFEGASGLDDAVEPQAVITLTGAGRLFAIAVDNAGRAFVADSERDAVYIIDGVAGRNGNVTADRTISGEATEFSQPFGLFLLED